MNEDFRFRASARTDEELYERINNRQKYLPETVEASIEELKSRDADFTDEELVVIGEDMEARRNMAASTIRTPSVFNRKETYCQVEDPDAPDYYSRRVITVFSILFSVLFGSVLMAINMFRAQKPSRGIAAVAYGLGFSCAAGIIASNFRINSFVAFIAGYIGAYGMELLFWNPVIGAGTLYRPKPIWIPLVIALVLSTCILYILFKYGTV